MRPKIQYAFGIKVAAAVLLAIFMFCGIEAVVQATVGRAYGAFSGYGLSRSQHMEIMVRSGPYGQSGDVYYDKTLEDLERYYQAAQQTDASAVQSKDELEELYSPQKTNIRARMAIRDAQGQTLHMLVLGGAWTEQTVSMHSKMWGNHRMEVGYDPNFEASDALSVYAHTYQQLERNKTKIIFSVMFFAIGTVMLALYLLFTAGRRAEDGSEMSVHLRFFDRWPVLVLGVILFLGYIVAQVLWEYCYYGMDVFWQDMIMLWVSGIAVWIFAMAVFFVLRSVVVRIKARCLLRTTLVYYIIQPILGLVYRYLHPPVPRTITVPALAEIESSVQSQGVGDGKIFEVDASKVEKKRFVVMPNWESIAQRARVLAKKTQNCAKIAVDHIRGFEWKDSAAQGMVHRIQTVLHTIWSAVCQVIGKMSLVGLGMLCGAVIAAIYCLIAISGGGSVAMGALIFSLIVLACLFWVLKQMERLQHGAQKLSQGDLMHKVDTKRLRGPFRQHAQILNHISAGMSIEVERRMKSERMKTELLTNVSHDIKTPLTSIINYVDLLKKVNPKPRQAKEYTEVLERQSLRLKKLLEDLIEASKAATGNINVTLDTMDAPEFLRQVIGEYNERLQEKGLTTVLQIEQEICKILADGKLLCRVFDNLMGNIVKYGMKGTRVYLVLRSKGDWCEIEIKNISREGLNVDAEELMERFVRGDTSRATEGSGLGLSIARSLTECMNGKFELLIDGDLFKVKLYFPLEKSEEQSSMQQ